MLELAIRRTDGPSLLVLSRQNLPALRTDTAENRCARGGYVLAESEGPRQATLISTGSEVPLAMAAREALAADGIGVAVVSLPCWELFAAQDESYRAQVLGGAPRVGIEAAGDFGWDRWLWPGTALSSACTVSVLRGSTKTCTSISASRRRQSQRRCAGSCSDLVRPAHARSTRHCELATGRRRPTRAG